jgi:hypothetical protein
VIKRRTVRPLVSASLALALGAPVAAWGQDVGPYDPLGLRAGAFRIYPTLTVAEAYNDNVYATKNNTDDDLITLIQPTITAQSNFTRHRLRLSAGGEFAIHLNEQNEDYQDFFVSSDGRLDITRQNFIDGNIEFARGHDSRDDPEDDGDRKQLEIFNDYGGQLSFTQLFNRLNFRILGSAVRTAYEESDEADRDQWSYTSALRAGFFVSPRINAFVQGSYNIRKRDRRRDFDGIDRDSSGFGADVGAEVDLTNLLVGEFAVGYRQQSYDQDGFDDQTGLGYDIDLTYTPTRLTTLVLNGGGDFRPTSSNGSGAESNFRSTVGLGVTHELLRNVRLGADVDYTRDDFNGPSRTDNTLGLGTGATYLINRNFSVNAGYTFTNRWSDLSDKEFTRNVVRIGVTARL